MDDPHNQRVVTMLTVEELLALKRMSDRLGLSDSAYLRRAVKAQMHHDAVGELSPSARYESSAEPAQLNGNYLSPQEQAELELGKTMAKLMKAYGR